MKPISIALILLLSSGQAVFAQEIATDTPPVLPSDAATPLEVPENPQTLADTTASVPAAQSDTTATTTVQDTFNTQDTADGGALQQTMNPEDLATSTVPLADATTTDTILVEATSTPDATPVDPTPQLDIVVDDVATDAPAEVLQSDIPAPVDTALAITDLTPKPEYTFAMTGKQLATRRLVAKADGTQQVQTVAAAVTPQIDNTTGTMHVSGACSDTYFVVLLFRDQDDYARDPQSYILNRAFPCENQSFSYDVSDLPDSLDDGTYYLLIGQEGEHGAWSPITGLTEVMINHAH